MLRKITGPFREFGLACGLLYAIDRLFASFSSKLRLHVYEFMVQPITDKPLLSVSLIKQLEVREIKESDPEIALMPVRPDVMRARFAQRAVCLGAFRKDAFVGYMWFCRGSYDEDEVRCTYVMDRVRESVFDFDFYIFPEYRLGLGFAGLWHRANEFLSGKGIRYTFSRLTRFNLGSRRAHQHLGWKVVGRALFLQAWRLEVMFGTLSPFVHVSAAKASRVRLVLRPDALGG